MPPAEIGTAQQEIPVTNITYIEVPHQRGFGYVKIIGNPAPVAGPKMRGYQAWLKRADKRQVTIFPDGKIWCEQQ
ncbi:hypothetical protein EBT25_13090 [bacterium]|nr:hypothetical protein [bacterium]